MVSSTERNYLTFLFCRINLGHFNQCLLTVQWARDWSKCWWTKDEQATVITLKELTV